MQILIELSTCFRAAFVLLWLGNAGECRGPNQVCFERSIIIIRMVSLWNRRGGMFSGVISHVVIPVGALLFSDVAAISLVNFFSFFSADSRPRKFHDTSNATYA